MKNKTSHVLITFVCIARLIFPVGQTFAASASAYDVVAAVNELRASSEVDELATSVSLMAAAQNQAAYLAAAYGEEPPDEQVGHSGVNGSDANDRASEAGYSVITGIQIQEVWTYAPSSIEMDDLLESFWGDEDDQAVLLQSYAVNIGAGVAHVGDMTYFVVNIAVDYASSPGGFGTLAGTETPEVVPVDVAAPQENGAIIHTVVKGQALWSIALAYGVTVDQIRALNNLAASNAIYEGQQLYIRAANTPTPSPSPTYTPMPPTRTPIPPQSPQALSTQVDPAKKDNALSLTGNNQFLGIVLIVVCGAGLILLGYSMLRKKD